MDQSTIARYQAGGDIYAQLLSQYGQASADAIAAAAATGIQTNVTAAIAQAKYGGNLDTSVLDIFGNQLATDPLGAPLASVNNQFSKFFDNLFKNKTLLVVVAVGIFLWLGGATLIRNLITGKK